MKLSQLLMMTYLNQRLMKSQWWSVARLAEHRESSFRHLVQCAYRDVPFYRTLFDRMSLRPDDIRGLADIGKIPIVDKSDLQLAEPQDLLSSRVSKDKLQRVSTSGSTGQPLSVHFTSKEFVAAHRASFSRFYRLYGRKLRDRVVYFGPGSSLTNMKRSLVSRVVPHNFNSIDSFSPIDDQIEILRNLDADIITGYTKSVENIAQALIDRSIKTVRPHLVYTGAEMLSESTRSLIKQAFGTDLLDTYNCIEFGNIAWECPTDSPLYHINEDTLIVEVVDESGKSVDAGIAGDILVTSLTNFTQPLIRYRLGDIAQLSKQQCSCGRVLGTLEDISGRKTESLTLPDGRQITPMYFWRLFRNKENIRQFQVIQETATDLTLRVVRNSKVGDAEPERAAMEDDLKFFSVRLEYVDLIELPETGKYRTFIPLRPTR